MSFNDIIKKSFLEGFTTDLTLENMLQVLVVTSILSLYIFAVYRVASRKEFYSKSFHISLVAMAVITSAIIVTIQSSVVVSLGMVGALSIVRFRTAIKNPMDLVFLFWSISVGIICGAGFYPIAAAVSVALTILILVLELLPVAKAPRILVLNMNNQVTEEQLNTCLTQYSRYYKVKSRSIHEQSMEIIYELKLKKDAELVRDLSVIEGISYVSLLSHDGEVSF